MDKSQIISLLEEMAILLELKGENPFKIRAYQNATRVLETSDVNIQQLVEEKKLSTIQGIGAGLAGAITELVTTGHFQDYEKLKAATPPGLLQMIRIQGLGPKKAKALFEELHIQDVPSLEKACREGKIAKLKGFGEKSQENILKGIAFLSQHAEYHRYDEADVSAQYVYEQLKALPQVHQIVICGSLRRHKEVVRDVDILISVKPGTEKNQQAATQRIMNFFVELPIVERVLGHGETKSSVLLKETGIQIDLRVVADREFPFAMHYFTGSKEHNIVMRQRAQDRGLKLNEYGLFKNDEPVACKDETALFKKLGLAYIPPELREDRGEFAAAEKNQIPVLITPKDIRGVFHVHSTWSDGKNSLEEMLQAAQDHGWEYVGISDHSKAAAYANGLTVDRVKLQAKEIERYRKKFKIHIFWGTECDILTDGSLDYPDDVLAEYDFVIASVHSNFTLPEAEMTRRISKALQNPYTTFLGHMTGRLLLDRPSYAVNIPEVLSVAAQEGVAVEINAHPKRFDLDWRHIPLAKEKGAVFSINPDAHSIENFDVMPYGVGIARKGWLTADDVVNTRSLANIKKWLEK